MSHLGLRGFTSKDIPYWRGSCLWFSGQGGYSTLNSFRSILGQLAKCSGQQRESIRMSDIKNRRNSPPISKRTIFVDARFGEKICALHNLCYVWPLILSVLDLIDTLVIEFYTKKINDLRRKKVKNYDEQQPPQKIVTICHWNCKITQCPKRL